LTEEAKADMLQSYPPFQRDARSKGIPQLGSGAIYPIPESEIVVPDFPIPTTWHHVYGLDVGWNATAAAWFAKDPVSKVTYLYSCYKRGEAEPSIHAAAIRGRGAWIPGVIDPSSRGRNQKDGTSLLDDYKDLGLILHPADNSVESGLLLVWNMLSTGMLKAFKSCQQYFEEYRLYRRDEKGKVVKTNDHIMDAKRYGIVSGLGFAIPKPTLRIPIPGDDLDYTLRKPLVKRGSGLV
jgi:hypothetical protein